MSSIVSLVWVSSAVSVTSVVSLMSVDSACRSQYCAAHFGAVGWFRHADRHLVVPARRRRRAAWSGVQPRAFGESRSVGVGERVVLVGDLPRLLPSPDAEGDPQPAVGPRSQLFVLAALQQRPRVTDVVAGDDGELDQLEPGPRADPLEEV